MPASLAPSHVLALTLVALAAAVPVSSEAAPGIALPAATMKLSPIGLKYLLLGGAAGFLGTPISAEKTAPDGIGGYQHFEHGSIYWSPTTGAHEVHGLIRARWAELGWEKGWLGYPMTDEINTYDGEGRVTKFEGGELIWREATGKVSDVRATDLLVDLPTKKGEPWKIIQANGLDDDSHQGKWVYCYDMIWNGDQGQTKGRQLVSSATAPVVWVDDSNTGSAKNNVIVQALGTGRYASTLHVEQGSYCAPNDGFGDIGFLPQTQPWDARPVPASGEALAKTGDVGAANGAYHIHYCITTAPDVPGFKPFESVPFAFRNYEVSKDDGSTWSSVSVGVPKRGDWVRRKSATGTTAKITAGVDVLNFGRVKGTISLPAGMTGGVGGTVYITVMSSWGEPLAATKYTLISLNANGPWSYDFGKLANYPDVKVVASYDGPTTPSASLVTGESTSFDVKANQTKTKNVALVASNSR